MKIRYNSAAKTCYIQLMPDLAEGEYIDYTHETPDDNVLADIKNGKVYGLELQEIDGVELA